MPLSKRVAAPFPARRLALGIALAGSVFPDASGAAGVRCPKFSAHLPDGLELIVAAAPPQVSYPIMGCLDDRGRLFIGDAAGLNLNQKGLEEKLPNRVLLLEDVDRDGVFEKSTVFADKMTFPQGACWLDGSLYVASPPGIWKANDAKKRRLETLAAGVAKGRIGEGARIFQNSTCAACHKVGNVGRAMGPDLSRLGQIRQPRDVLESIFFPSATIARDYEAHVIETTDGQTHLGVIKSDVADGVTLIDVAGQEKNVPHARIVANSVMASSLMPAGLEQTFSEQELLDLVAWFVSLK